MTSQMEPNGESISKWGPKHEQVALLSASGATNKDIAEVVGFSENWIGKIVRDPRAQLAQANFVRALRERLLKKFDNRILELADYAIRNLGRTVKADVDPDHLDKKRHQDKMSVEVIKFTGLGESQSDKRPVIQITSDQLGVLAGAITKSDEAREIYEAEYEMVDDNTARAEPA